MRRKSSRNWTDSRTAARARTRLPPSSRCRGAGEHECPARSRDSVGGRRLERRRADAASAEEPEPREPDVRRARRRGSARLLLRRRHAPLARDRHRASARMTTPARILIVEDVATDAQLIEREIRRAGIVCVTRRVDAEPALREALRTFAPDLVLSDHSLPQLTAADSLRLAHPEDLPRLQAVLADLLGRPGTPVTVGLRLRHHDGAWRAVEAVFVNRLLEPAVGAVVVNLRDVSER